MNALQDHGTKPSESEQEQLLNVLKEESNNLKARMIQLSEENNKLKRDKTMLTQCAGAEFREQIER